MMTTHKPLKLNYKNRYQKLRATNTIYVAIHQTSSSDKR